MDLFEIINDTDVFMQRESNEKYRQSGRGYLVVYLIKSSAKEVYKQLKNERFDIKFKPSELVVAEGFYDEDNKQRCVVAYLGYSHRPCVFNPKYFRIKDIRSDDDKAVIIPYLYKNCDRKICIQAFREAVDMMSQVKFFPPNVPDYMNMEVYTLLELSNELGRGHDNIFNDTYCRSVIPWNGDVRSIMADELKDIFKLERMDARPAGKYIVTKYHNGTMLDEVDIRQLCAKDIDKVRIVYSFRYLLGMRRNIDSSIAIVNGNPVSLYDKFPSGPMKEHMNDRLGLISGEMSAKWFKARHIKDYVTMLPIFKYAKQNMDDTKLRDLREKLLDKIKRKGNHSTNGLSNEEYCEVLIERKVKNINEIASGVINRVEILLSEYDLEDMAELISVRLRGAIRRLTKPE